MTALAREMFVDSDLFVDPGHYSGFMGITLVFKSAAFDCRQLLEKIRHRHCCRDIAHSCIAWQTKLAVCFGWRVISLSFQNIADNIALRSSIAAFVDDVYVSEK